LPIHTATQIHDSSAASYTLGPGDKIDIQVFGEKELSIRGLILGNQGTINYPFLGKVKITGMTPVALQQVITDGLRGDYLRDPQVRVTITAYRPFYISGEVKHPGDYPFHPGLTFAKAISLAGGFETGATDGQVQVIHENKAGQEIMPMRAFVAPGDNITVKQSKYFMNGEVRLPGGYPFRTGLTLRQAIALAGGFSKGASEGWALVIHKGDANHQEQQVSLDADVVAGDIVTVKQSLFYVNGEVKRPGGYPFQPNLTARMAVSIAGGFTERASKDKVMVIHRNDAGREHRLPLTGEVKSGDTITVEQSFF